MIYWLESQENARTTGRHVNLFIEVVGDDFQEEEAEDLVLRLYTYDVDEDTEVVVTGISLDQTIVTVMKLLLALMKTPNQQSSALGVILMDITEENAHRRDVHI